MKGCHEFSSQFTEKMVVWILREHQQRHEKDGSLLIANEVQPHNERYPTPI